MSSVYALIAVIVAVTLCSVVLMFTWALVKRMSEPQASVNTEISEESKALLRQVRDQEKRTARVEKGSRDEAQILIYEPRTGRPERRCDCHGDALRSGDPILWWPRAEDDGVVLFCSRSPEFAQFRQAAKDIQEADRG